MSRHSSRATLYSSRDADLASPVVLNILTVIHYPVYGGPHNQAAVLNDPLLARGIHTTVVLPLHSDAAASRLAAARVPVHQIPLHRIRATKDPRALAGLIARFPAELRHLRRLIHDLQIDIVQIGGLVNPHGRIVGAHTSTPRGLAAP